MLFLKNKAIRVAVVVIGIAACAIPAAAGSGVTYHRPDYLSHSDTIWPTVGDAPASNLIIQTPTPWPRHVNDTFIPTDAWPAIVTITRYRTKTLKLSPEGSTGEMPSVGVTTTGAASQ